MNEYLNKIEEEEKYVNDFKLNTNKGTKNVREDFHANAVKAKNSYIDEKIKEYEAIQNAIKEELNRRKDMMMPKKRYNFDMMDETTKTLKKMLLYETKANNENKLGLSYIFNKFKSNTDNLDEINRLIKVFLKTFKDAGISLTNEDFKYTLYTYRYMNVFLKNIDDPNFDDIIRGEFEKIYYACPNIITHLRLNLIDIKDRYHKELDNYVRLIDANEHNYTKEYYESLNKINGLKDMDKYNLSSKFLDGTINPEDYTEKAAKRVKTFNRFLIGASYDSLSDDDKEDYYNHMVNLKYLIIELKNYNKFKPFIDETLKRYKSKDSYKGVTKTKEKELNKLKSQRDKIVKDIFPHKTLFKYVDNTKNEELILKQNNVVMDISKTFDEYENDVINDELVKYLNDTSSVLDIMKFVLYNYSYFEILLPKLGLEEKEEDVYNELMDYVYSKHNRFSDNINILSKEKIEDIIVNKYKLININLTDADLKDLDSLTSDVEYINTVFKVERGGVKFDELCTINNIQNLDSKK